MFIMARLWKDLPSEVLEIVLACLPAHVLCRCRLVCKRWNHLITQPGFVSLHAQTLRQASYVLLSPKMLDRNPWLQGKRGDWEILDMAGKRFYTLSDSFIIDYTPPILRDRVLGFDFKYRGWSKYTLAADGGLIYVVYVGVRTGVQIHIVCNPVSKSFHQITELELPFSYESEIVVMSADNGTKSYRIVTIESYDSAWTVRQQVSVYDSTTTQWRNLCEVPDKFRAYSSIFLKGIFYTLLVDTSMVPWCPKLYSCDLETGEWSYFDAELPQPSCLQDKLQLVVSLGRLFVVEYTGLPIFQSIHLTDWESLLVRNRVRKKQLIKVCIWEILLVKKEVVKMAEFPKYSKYPRSMVDDDRPQALLGDVVVALGYADSIVISSLVGRLVGFDLSRNCWYDLPASAKPVSDTNRPGGAKCEGICAGLVHLDLTKMSR